MSRHNNQLRHITYAAWHLAEAPLWLDALADMEPAAAVPALCDLLSSSADEIVRVLAARTLAKEFADHPSVRATLISQLSCPSSPVRASVARHAPISALPVPVWRRVLARDPAPLVRRAAARALAGLQQWSDIVRIGLSDPVWRVRRDAAESLIRCDLSDAARDSFLSEAESGRHARRAVAFIRARVADDITLPPEPERPGYTRLPWWSEDPAVMLARVRHVPADQLASALPELIALVEWQDGYPLTNCMHEMRALIGRLVHARGSCSEWRTVASYLDQPRIPYAQAWAGEWLARCPSSDALADDILQAGSGRDSLVWAIARVAPPTELDSAVSPRVNALLQCVDSVHSEVRSAALGALQRWLQSRRDGSTPVIGTRFQSAARSVARFAARDSHPDVLAAALGLLCACDGWRVARALMPDQLDPASARACLLHLPDVWLRSERHRPWLARIATAASNPPNEIETRIDPDAETGTFSGISLRVALGQRAAAAQLWSISDLLGRDPDHRVRAAAMTPARAAELCAQPELEASWRVLARAAEVCQKPLSDLAPGGLQTWPVSPLRDGQSSRLAPTGWHTESYFQTLEMRPGRALPDVALPSSPPECQRPLGTGRMIAPLILSGRHSLSETGFACALEGGVNCLFWEPEYRAQTRFIRALDPTTRRQLVFVGGTFAHEPEEVRADIDAMLHVLDIERIDLFFLFWVRDRARLGDTVARALLDAQTAGKIAAFGLSTHDRALARDALEIGWNTLMLRHSAAHPGIESEVLPGARALGAQVLTFSNLTYTLMLRSRAGQPPPYEAADCYRYSLSQPGVTACISAPRTVREVKHNLRVLHSPTVAPAFQERMRAYAARVRLESHRMMRLIRAD